MLGTVRTRGHEREQADAKQRVRQARKRNRDSRLASAHDRQSLIAGNIKTVIRWTKGMSSIKPTRLMPHALTVPQSLLMYETLRKASAWLLFAGIRIACTVKHCSSVPQLTPSKLTGNHTRACLELAHSHNGECLPLSKRESIHAQTVQVSQKRYEHLISISTSSHMTIT